MKNTFKKTASLGAIATALPTIKNGKGVSLAGATGTKGTPVAVIPAKGKNAPAKASPAAPKGKGTAKGATTSQPTKDGNAAPRLVYLDLPLKGTERFTSDGGIDWIRHTPGNGDMANWYQMAPKGTAETGIHAAKKNKDGSWTLTMDRARLPYRKRNQILHGKIREIE